MLLVKAYIKYYHSFIHSLRPKHNHFEYAEIQLKKFRSYRRFLSGITSKATKRVYIEFMRNFMKFHNLSDYDKLAKYKTEKIDILIEDYIYELDSRELKAITIRTNLAGIERFFEMNDCIWHRKRIRRGMKKDTEIPGGKEPITTKEIQKMLSCTKSLRTKALIHFLASTGTRPGALVDPVLKIKHLERIDDCYCVKIYDESSDGYWSFLTPEATRSLDDYLQRRKLKGEQLDDESHIFSMMIDRNAKNHHMTEDNTRYIINNLIKMAGVKRTKVSKHRYDKAIVYMFRKRFNTILKINNDVNSNIVEKLMAHKKGLNGVYMQPTKEECYKEFFKAIPDLTIDNAERERTRAEKAEAEKAVIENKQQKEIDALHDELERVNRWISSKDNLNN